jgi:hypothetical protein
MGTQILSKFTPFRLAFKSSGFLVGGGRGVVWNTFPVYPERVFLDVIETKILRLLPHAIHSRLHKLISAPPPPLDFLGLEISTATAKSRVMALLCYIISLFTFESNIVLSLFTFYFYINSYFPNTKNNYKCIRRRKT